MADKAYNDLYPRFFRALPFGIIFSQTQLDSNIRHQTIAEESAHFVDYQLFFLRLKSPSHAFYTG